MRSYAINAYILASRGYMHDGSSLGQAYADDIADANMRAVDGRPDSFETCRPHGPVQWLEPTPRECAVPQHIQDRMFTPVDVMRGQTGMEI